MTRIKRQLSRTPIWLGIAGTVLATVVLWTARATPLGETRIFARNPSPVSRSVPEQPSLPDVVISRPSVPDFNPENLAALVPALARPEPAAPEQPEAAPDHSGMLTVDREFALGMIESGNDDGAVGGLGEVSRYQIMPSVWKHYSESRNYGNQEAALDVARQHWNWLHQYFEARARRTATDFDMYVLWNTRHGYYASKGFHPDRLHPVVKDRAQRFANLVERGAG